jgi:autotransporter-associated beta strand protein
LRVQAAFDLGSKQLTVGSNNLSTVVSGSIADGGLLGGTGGSLVKLGTGTLTLTGADTYTGGSTIGGGVLEVDGSIAASNLTTVNSGAALTGAGTVGNTQVDSGGTFAPGNGAAGSSMTVTGNLAFASGALYLAQVRAHDFDPDRSIAATFQTLPGASFVVNGAAQASDSALVTASIEKKWLNGWSATATFEGEFSDVTRSYAGKGVVRYQW